MKYHVEDCYAITPSLVAQKEGSFNVPRNGLLIDFNVEQEGMDEYLVLESGNGRPQRIKLAYVELYLGTRTLFECDCGRRAHKLYLPPHGHLFKCRLCWELSYKSSGINKNTPQGRVLEQGRRIMKAMDYGDTVGNRLICGNDFTLKQKQYLKYCKEAGMNEVVEAADKFLAMVRLERQRI